MLMAGSCSVLLNLFPVEIAYCMATAALPDKLETIGRVRIIAHRTWTHELLVWLVPLILVMFSPSLLPNSHLSMRLDRFWVPIHFRLWAFFLPGLFHLAGDILTIGGIKVAGSKVSLALFRTGQPMEYVVTAIFVVLAGAHIFPRFLL